MRFAGFLLFVAGLMTMPVAHAAEARSAERLVKNAQQGVVYAIPKESPFKVEKKSIGTEFDVITHHGRVHPNEFNWKGIDNEFHFDVYCTINNIKYAGLGEAVD